MKVKTVLLILTLALAPALCAQSSQPPSGAQTRAERRQQMMEMHKQEMEAMKTDIASMKASLADMNANSATIKDLNELARWRDNANLWERMIGHMEQMQKHMEMMGPDMTGSGMGGLFRGYGLTVGVREIRPSRASVKFWVYSPRLRLCVTLLT